MGIGAWLLWAMWMITAQAQHDWTSRLNIAAQAQAAFEAYLDKKAAASQLRQEQQAQQALKLAQAL